MKIKLVYKFIQLHNCAGEPGFFNGAGHQMAFHRKRNCAAGFFSGGEGSGKILHDAYIAATMTTSVCSDMDDPFLKSFGRGGYMFPDPDLPL